MTRTSIVAIVVAVVVGGLVAGERSRADTQQTKRLMVNTGTRQKNQFSASLEEVAVAYGPIPTSSALGAVRLSGPNLIPQCVIYTATLAEAVALAAEIQSDKTASVDCSDETISASTVIIEMPPRAGQPSACPKGLGCSGQSVDIEGKP